MLEDLKNEMSAFFKDIDDNIKNQDDLIYVKTRTAKLVDFIADEIEKIIDYKEEKLNAIIKKQEQEDLKIKELSEKIDTVFEDIYDEPSDEFLISCPYCNNEFDAEIDEDSDEIRCPECGNLIELDWNGNPDDDEKETRLRRKLLSLWWM
jgi:DNA-directed RNA polymerase subunit RPC12/RpoP